MDEEATILLDMYEQRSRNAHLIEYRRFKTTGATSTLLRNCFIDLQPQ